MASKSRPKHKNVNKSFEALQYIITVFITIIFIFSLIKYVYITTLMHTNVLYLIRNIYWNVSCFILLFPIIENLYNL